MVLPPQLLILSLFQILLDYHLYNTLTGLILVYVAGHLAMTVYILEGFFAQIPQDLFDAARMKEAAAELSVTPGAISQLVRGLEARVGTQLFRRGNRSLVLTEAGQSYFAPIRHAFRQIGEATRQLQAMPHADHRAARRHRDHRGGWNRSPVQCR